MQTCAIHTWRRKSHTHTKGSHKPFLQCFYFRLKIWMKLENAMPSQKSQNSCITESTKQHELMSHKSKTFDVESCSTNLKLHYSKIQLRDLGLFDNEFWGTDEATCSFRTLCTELEVVGFGGGWPLGVVVGFVCGSVAVFDGPGCGGWHGRE